MDTPAPKRRRLVLTTVALSLTLTGAVCGTAVIVERTGAITEDVRADIADLHSRTDKVIERTDNAKASTVAAKKEAVALKQKTTEAEAALASEKGFLK